MTQTFDINTRVALDKIAQIDADIFDLSEMSKHASDEARALQASAIAAKEKTFFAALATVAHVNERKALEYISAKSHKIIATQRERARKSQFVEVLNSYRREMRAQQLRAEMGIVA